MKKSLGNWAQAGIFVLTRGSKRESERDDVRPLYLLTQESEIVRRGARKCVPRARLLTEVTAATKWETMRGELPASGIG